MWTKIPLIHLQATSIAIAGWFIFWLGGLPDYYQQYSFLFSLIGVIALTPGLLWICVYFIKVIPGGTRLHAALLVAFYGSVPFFILDYLYCGVYLGLGIGFLKSHWYLTVFYILPWLYLPCVGKRLDSRSNQT